MNILVAGHRNGKSILMANIIATEILNNSDKEAHIHFVDISANDIDLLKQAVRGSLSLPMNDKDRLINKLNSIEVPNGK